MNIYINFLPGFTGGPSVFAARFYEIFGKRNHTLLNNLSVNCDAALWSISPPDLTQINFCKQNKIPILYRIAGIYIQEFFDSMNEPNPGITYNQQVKNILPSIDTIIFQSTWSKRIICETLDFEPQSCKIIYNATDTDFFKTSDHPMKNSNGYLNIICTGSLRRRFRIQVPFEILKRLKLKSRVLFVGNVDEQCRAELDKISASVYADRVIHIPHVDHHNLLTYLQSSHIFLHPVQGDACPNAVIEALSCGLPVVCGSWGGQSELIGEGGIVVQNIKKWDYGEEFIEGCCKAIEEIALNIDAFRVKARKRAEEMFNLERFYTEYYEVMQNDT